MARASTITKLPLDRWAAIMGVNPLAFNQIEINTIKPLSTCAHPWKQFAWQDADQIGREDIARAILAAEGMIEDYTRTRLIPSWEADERHMTRQPGQPDLIKWASAGPRGFSPNIQATWGNFVSGGIEAKTLIAAASAITYTDPDGDTYFETATVTVASPSTVPVCEIAVYYPGLNADSAWEIRPLVSVTQVGANKVIVFTRQQAVLPALLDTMNPKSVDGLANGNFLTTVDVYRHWNDPSQQVQLMWSPSAGGCGCGGDPGCASCQYATQYGCLIAMKPRISVANYHPGVWDPTTSTFSNDAYAECRNPDHVRLWYYAGNRNMSLTCPNIQMDHQWELAVTYLSLALLDRAICECTNIQKSFDHWAEEFNLNQSNPAGSTTYQLAQRSLECPWGVTRGALYAWNVANAEGSKIGRAVAY